MMTIEELLIDFDEMGFVPTTLCENPDEYAQDWKKQLLVEIKRLEKDFAEKMKKYSYTDNCFTDGKWHRYVLVSDIDELLKEYENGKQR